MLVGICEWATGDRRGKKEDTCANQRRIKWRAMGQITGLLLKMMPRWDLDKCEWPGDGGLLIGKVQIYPDLVFIVEEPS